MNRYFRYLVLNELQKTAALSDDIKSVLKTKGFTFGENKPKYSDKIIIPGAIPGAAVKVPDEPIINGKYNVMFQIRPGHSATDSGINTIIVSCEAAGMSGELARAYGNSTWVKNQLNIIQDKLSKKFPGVSLGKLGFASFSGGYDAVIKILQDPEIKEQVDSVVILDGIHQGKRGQPNPVGMKPWVDLAEMAKKDPSKKFVFLYTAVDPGEYASTSDSAFYINKQLGLENVPFDGSKTYAGIKPAAIAQSGGYTAIQLFPRLDDKKPGYGYSKAQGGQHILASKALPEVWGEYLADWNKG